MQIKLLTILFITIFGSTPVYSMGPKTTTQPGEEIIDPYPFCDLCHDNPFFDNQTDLNYHKQNHHTCRICQKSFKSILYLRSHMQKRHKAELAKEFDKK